MVISTKERNIGTTVPSKRSVYLCGMESRNIVFLDVDGVLTTSRCLLDDYEEDDDSLCFSWNVFPPFNQLNGSRGERFVPLEKVMIQNLKYLIETTSSKIVISSTWRENDDMKSYLIRALESQGIASDTVIGQTPFLGCLEGRGAEIRLWLNENQWSNFVILDDDHMTSFTQHQLQHHVIQTIIRHEDRSLEGLTLQKCHEAISILSSPPPSLQT